MEQKIEQHRRVDMRVQKTREAIKNAFTEMVLEMDADDITVKELAERARIHRKTFYLHYTSIEALFEDMLQDMANSYYKEIDAVAEPMSADDVNRVFFAHSASRGTFYERLINAPSYRDFCTKLFSVTLKHNRNRYNPYAHLSQDEQNVVNAFLVSATLEMYRQWIADDKRIPLERMIELSSQLLNTGAQSIREEG